MQKEFKKWVEVLEYINTLKENEYKRLLIQTRYNDIQKELYWIVIT